MYVWIQIYTNYSRKKKQYFISDIDQFMSMNKCLCKLERYFYEKKVTKLHIEYKQRHVMNLCDVLVIVGCNEPWSVLAMSR